MIIKLEQRTNIDHYKAIITNGDENGQLTSMINRKVEEEEKKPNWYFSRQRTV